eukprot:55630_1
MTQYAETDIKSKQFLNNFENMLQLLNDFTFLSTKFDSNKEFEIIANELGQCNTTNCGILRRHFRSRNNGTIEFVTDITDKIHCYYQHSFDNGNRLTPLNAQKLSEMKNDEKYDDVTMNINIKQLNVLLSSQKTKHSKSSNMNQRFKSKYNDFYQKSIQSTETVFSYGAYFAYVVMDELASNSSRDVVSEEFLPAPKIHYRRDCQCYKANWCSCQEVTHIPILSKYSSLKQEMINNAIAAMNIKQFNMEYSKALVHFHTNYCKQFKNILLEEVLSLMIYCNYTKIQYHFSKTYR